MGAAAALNITPAAVSQRIRNLEQELGVRLFHRLTRQVTLTEDGQLLATRIRPILSSLTEAVLAVSRRASSEPLTITTTNTFAEQCLLPALGEFSAICPSVSVRVLVSNDLVNLAAQHVDVAIRQGYGNYPGSEVKWLFNCIFVPVAAPNFEPVTSSAPLICVDWPKSMVGTPNWTNWFARNMPKEMGRAPTIHVPTEAMAIRMAIAGQGLALVGIHHVREELAVGSLVLPYGQNSEMATELSYYMVRTPHSVRGTAKALWDWIEARFSDPRPGT